MCKHDRNGTKKVCKTMNVLIINASPRKKGVTSTLLAEVESAISPAHHTETVRIRGLDMKPCTGCLQCRPDRTCVLPRDDSHILAEKIKQADFLIIGCPVYWGNMPGTLKIFFDRNVPLFEYCEARAINYIPRPQLKGKKAMLVVCGGSPLPYSLLPSQSRGTVRALKTVLRSGGVRITSVLNIPDTYNFAEKKERYIRKAQQLAGSI